MSPSAIADVDAAPGPAEAAEVASRGTVVDLVPQVPRYPGCDSQRVFTVGDSLTDGIVNFGGNYHSRLVAVGYAPTSVYKVGQFTWWGVGQLRTAISAGRVGGIVVVALGSNDAYKTPRSYLDAFKARVDEVMALVGPDRTVIWVNLQFGKPGAASYLDMVAMAAPYNAALQQKAAIWPNLVVLDWDSTANRPYLGADQIHYSPTGYRNRAIAIVEAIVAISCRGA